MNRVQGVQKVQQVHESWFTGFNRVPLGSKSCGFIRFAGAAACAMQQSRAWQERGRPKN